MLKEINSLKPKQSWKSLSDHFMNALNDDWYKIVCLLQDSISFHTASFYRKKGMKTLHLPITTGSISSPMGLGSDSLPVQVSLFDVDTYLADSMQFMLEYGCRIFNEGCYYLMPSFRGEDADSRHLCQFYHSEAEIIGDLNDVINLVEEYIKYLCKNILDDLRFEFTEFGFSFDHIERVATSESFKRLTFDQACELLENKEEYFKYHPEGFRTITNSGEKKLIELNNGIVWLTEFDSLSVPFYQATLEEDNSKVKCADLLFGIGEVVGAGQRHSNSKSMDLALKSHNVGKSEYEWYAKMKDQTPMETSGFGMGIERFILWLLDHNDIRDTQLLPRFNGINVVP